jgi:hypothetical protein
MGLGIRYRNQNNLWNCPCCGTHGFKRCFSLSGQPTAAVPGLAVGAGLPGLERSPNSTLSFGLSGLRSCLVKGRNRSERTGIAYIRRKLSRSSLAFAMACSTE